MRLTGCLRARSAATCVYVFARVHACRECNFCHGPVGIRVALPVNLRYPLVPAPRLRSTSSQVFRKERTWLCATRLAFCVLRSARSRAFQAVFWSGFRFAWYQRVHVPILVCMGLARGGGKRRVLTSVEHATSSVLPFGT